LPCKYGQALRR